MATQRIVFTEWLPDQPSSVGALVDAKNVMPNQVGYKPFPTAQNYGSAAGEDLIATVSGKFDDVTQLFSGSATKLYQYNGVNHINVSKSSRIISNIERTSNVVTVTTTTDHGYSVSDSVVVGATTNTGINGTFTVASVPTTTTFTYAQVGADIASVADSGRVYRDTYNASQWRFTQFGANVLAVDNNSKMQYWEVNQSVSFEDASADSPVAKYITTVRDFVVVANVGGVANKVQWSDINDFTDWTSGSASQSDYQLLPDGNTIQGITGGEFGVIFLEKAIVRMSYIGSPLFFQFDTIARNLGCIASGSIAQFGATSFWLADDGFYSTDGNVVTPIGVEKVDRYFFDNLDYNSLSTISSSIDPVNKLVVWNYPKATGGRELIMYNWQIQRWSRAETDVTTMAYAATATTTLEALDNFGTIDTLPASLDSSIWAGGVATLKGTRGQYIVAFNGSSSTANIVTQDIEIGFNSTITLARTQIDNGSSTIQVASRKMLDDTITYSSSVTTDDENRASLRSSGRYHRLSVTPTGNWTSAIGVDVDITPRGLR
jgi:hypothetical protein